MKSVKYDKVHFHPGDVVRVRHLLENQPQKMIVKKVNFTNISIKSEETGQNEVVKRLLGVVCFWFDKNMVYNEKDFNSKDLEFIEE